jgi:hypothetical protein
MADNRPVLVKTLNAESPLDRGATFTGEEKKAKLVRKTHFKVVNEPH